ncbi:MAG: hypothetical protein A2Z88_00880 [Omnitrophica WOR_2 bacterium GWA2_47_8]|nr:MAG: hypothetical protein A2Z88_00880 [Omnitrophica WOR_2 bacterium GWA2_47_8]
MTKKAVFIITATLLALNIFSSAYAQTYPVMQVSATPQNPINQCAQNTVSFQLTHPKGWQPGLGYIFLFDPLTLPPTYSTVSAQSLQYATFVNTVNNIQVPSFIVGPNTAYNNFSVGFIYFYKGGRIAVSDIIPLQFIGCPQGSTIAPLSVGPGFSGITPEPSAQGNPTNPFYDQYPIARWDDEAPHQLIGGRDGATGKNICVFAVHTNGEGPGHSGIQKVEISANGGPWVNITEKQLNPETNILGYCARLNSEGLASGLNVETRAIVYPMHGRPLVLQGAPTRDIEVPNAPPILGTITQGLHSQFVRIDNGRYPEPIVYLHNVNGDDTTCVAENQNLPCRTLLTAVNKIAAVNLPALGARRLDGGIIRALPSTEPYAFGLPFLNPDHQTLDTYLKIVGYGDREQIVFNRYNIDALYPWHNGIMARDSKVWVENVKVFSDPTQQEAQGQNGAIIRGGTNYSGEVNNFLVVKHTKYRGIPLWVTPQGHRFAGGAPTYLYDIDYGDESEGPTATYANGVQFNARINGVGFQNTPAIYNAEFNANVSHRGTALGPGSWTSQPFPNHPDLTRFAIRGRVNAIMYNVQVLAGVFISAQGFFLPSVGGELDGLAVVNCHWRNGGLVLPPPGYVGRSFLVGGRLKNVYFLGGKIGEYSPNLGGALNYYTGFEANDVVYDDVEFPNGPPVTEVGGISQVSGVTFR